jgi:hypothetical protein
MRLKYLYGKEAIVNFLMFLRGPVYFTRFFANFKQTFLKPQIMPKVFLCGKLMGMVYQLENFNVKTPVI